MKNTFRLFVALFTLIISSTLCFAGSKTLTLTAGNLSSQITEEEKTNTTTIILSGEIDQRDIIFMRDEMSSLTSIDIKNCKIMSHSVFEENVLPEYSF